MVASCICLLIEITSFLIYLNLFVLNRWKVHLFTPFMKYVPKAKLKEFQKAYYSSLRRDFYCVSDKVDVSGTSFNIIFLFAFFFNVLTNAFFYDQIASLNFHIIAIPHFVFTMFCLTSYRGRRELCFYCYYPMFSNTMYIFLLAFFFL